MALDPLSAGFNLATQVGKIVDKFIPDKDQAARLSSELQTKLIDLIGSGDVAQAAVNAEEAKHPSIFVSGWRPATGWLCALGLGWTFLGQPVFSTVWWAVTQTPAPAPAIDDGSLMVLVTGLLGIAGYRTFEKFKKVTQ